MRAGSAPKIARRYFISGRVQGVGFRYFVEKAATQIGVLGYARNMADGRVEVYATGAPEQIEELAGYLWRGPRFADVRGVEEMEAEFKKCVGFRAE